MLNSVANVVCKGDGRSVKRSEKQNKEIDHGSQDKRKKRKKLGHIIIVMYNTYTTTGVLRYHLLTLTLTH